MSAPANRRSAGSRRFNPLKALLPKRRLQQMLSPSPPVFIELDYIPMETGFMVSMRQSRGFLTPQSPERNKRRTPAPASTRDPYGHTSLSSSNSGSCKGSEGSPTPRRNLKYTSCGDNHGIRPPPPEQYLTPLQQKEVCIRHLRGRLRDTIDRLQNRDTEVDELKTQLSRMQEDWIEEECHRVEAQLALKEARKEIQQLKEVIDVVRTNLSDTDTGAVQKYFQDINVQNLKLESLLYSVELAQNGATGEDEAGGAGGGAGAGSGEGSLTRSSTYTRLSDPAPTDRNGNAPDVPSLSGEETLDSGCVCGDSRADLLLEASFLSEETAALLGACSRLPQSSSAETLLPLRCRSTGGSGHHPCLSHHHHLFLHHLREQAIQTECDLDPVAKRAFRSQACSPTSTWLSEEGEDFDTVTTATAAVDDDDDIADDVADDVALLDPSPDSCADLPRPEADGEAPPQTCQPRSTTPQAEQGGVTVVEVEEEEEEGEGGEAAAPEEEPLQQSYWSRHFLVDLLAVAMPVVPAVAWLCHAPRREVQPVHSFGSLLRGCCTVALHSLRRSGGGWHYPAGSGGSRGPQI